MTGSVGEGEEARGGSPRVHPAVARAWRSLVERTLRALDRLRLPGATVLPVAGAVVGLYGGLRSRRRASPRRSGAWTQPTWMRSRSWIPTGPGTPTASSPARVRSG